METQHKHSLEVKTAQHSKSQVSPHCAGPHSILYNYSPNSRHHQAVLQCFAHPHMHRPTTPILPHKYLRTLLTWVDAAPEAPPQALRVPPVVGPPRAGALEVGRRADGVGKAAAGVAAEAEPWRGGRRRQRRRAADERVLRRWTLQCLGPPMLSLF